MTAPVNPEAGATYNTGEPFRWATPGKTVVYTVIVTKTQQAQQTRQEYTTLGKMADGSEPRGYVSRVDTTVLTREIFRGEVCTRPSLAALAALIEPPAATADQETDQWPAAFGVGDVIARLSVMFRAGATDIPASMVPWFRAALDSDPHLLHPAWATAPRELTFIAATTAAKAGTFRQGDADTGETLPPREGRKYADV
jgi:hypothetical protein